MALLDDLKREAQQRLAAEAAEQDADQLEAGYRKNLRPAMLAIFNYLSELTDQLKVIDPDVRWDYTLPGIGLVPGLHQGGYLLNADSAENTKKIRLRFTCTDDREREYAIRPKATADETRAFLQSQRMRFTEWPIRDAGQSIVGLNFQLTIQVIVEFMIKADPERNSIIIASANFAEFKMERIVISPERIDNEWLDNFGNYLLRRRENLFRLDITDDDKALIREKLEAEQRLRDAELQDAILREQEEQELARRNSMLGRLKSLALPDEVAAEKVQNVLGKLKALAKIDRGKNEEPS